MALPTMQTKPHVPTLVYALVAVVVLILLYHFIAGRRRK